MGGACLSPLDNPSSLWLQET
ncbi:unnamed protein product [Gulo gulo]|uniref:Uncharacterized protein n=1 Tax=Gulo gulo TaxID=48420 RepID=A0A9X9LNA9_GULGU|nr:unnamed protein product [Gulo gulo]